MGQSVGPFFGGQELDPVGFLNPEDETDRLSRNVGKKLQLLLRNNPEEHRSQQLGGGSLK